MLQIVDQESCTQFDINDYWKKEVRNTGSTTYFDRQSNKTFTTLKKKSGFQCWDTFWISKDRANSELLRAVYNSDHEKAQNLVSLDLEM